jgi:hypothetical protein
VALTQAETERLQELALAVCEAFEQSGLHCILVLDGHGTAWMAATGQTEPLMAGMLAHALKAAQQRSARRAN